MPHKTHAVVKNWTGITMNLGVRAKQCTLNSPMIWNRNMINSRQCLIKSCDHLYLHQIYENTFTCYQYILKTVWLCARSLEINQWTRNMHILLESRDECVKFNWYLYVIRFKSPPRSVERDWVPMIVEQCQGAQEKVAELCRSVVSPPWGVTERAEVQTIVARPPPVVTRNFNNRIEA